MNFKEIKHVLRAFIYLGGNRGKCLREYESRTVKIRDAVDESFHLHENSHKLCRRF